MNVALTIAGSDSGGGAGIQADLKSFHANGVFGASVITAITAQNTRTVTRADTLAPDLIRAQLDAVLDDLPIAAVKTGMLADSATIVCVADALSERFSGPVVVDPVMISKGGFPLLSDDAVATLRERMLPLATLLTPNAHEAARLVDHPVRDAAEAEAAARALCALGAAAVLVKGGHLDREAEAVDVLYDGHRAWHFRSERVNTPHTHGTGCTYAAAIAANLAKRYDLPTAVERSKRYVDGAIRHGLALGGGHGPTHHFWFLQGQDLFPFEG